MPRSQSPETTSHDLHRVSDFLGLDILPKYELAKEGVTELSADVFRQNLPVRYEIYEQVLAALAAEQTLTPDQLAYFTHRLTVLNRLDEYIYIHHQQQDPVLRPHQIQFFEKLQRMLESGEVFRTGHVNYATRSGKTVVFSELVKALRMKTLIVVPTIIIGDQTFAALDDRFEVEEIGRIIGGKKQYGKNVEIISYQALVQDIESGKIRPEEYEVVIYDEAQHMLSDEQLRISSLFQNALRLGFTASPTYEYGKQLNQFNALPPLIDRLDIRDAAEDGIIAPFQVYEAYVKTKTRIDFSKVKRGIDGDYSERDLEKALDLEELNRAALEILSRPDFRNRLTLINCASLGHASALAEYANKNGFRAVMISGEDSPKQQRELLQRAADGEIDILTTKKLLTIGVNRPEIYNVFNLVPTLSLVHAIQRGGRGLTPDPANPHKTSRILEFIPEDKDGSSVRFADVISGEAERAKLTPKYKTYRNGGSNGGRPKEDRDLYKVLEIGEVELDVETKEVVSVLSGTYHARKVENAGKERVKVRAGVLAKLLGITIAALEERLPHYYQNLEKSQGELEALLKTLRKQERGEATIEIPARMYREMVVDTLTCRLESEMLVDKFPDIAQKLLILLGGVSQHPEIKKIYDELNFFAGYVKVDELGNAAMALQFHFLIKRLRNLAESDVFLSKETRLIQESLEEAKMGILRYAHSTAVVRERVRHVMSEQPLVVIHAMHHRNAIQDTELFQYVENILDTDETEGITQTLNAYVFCREAATYDQTLVVQNILHMAKQIPDEGQMSLQQLSEQVSMLEISFENYQAAVEVGNLALVTRMHQEIGRVLMKVKELCSKSIERHNQGKDDRLTESTRSAVVYLRHYVFKHMTNRDMVTSVLQKHLANDYLFATKVKKIFGDSEGVWQLVQPLLMEMRQKANFHVRMDVAL